MYWRHIAAGRILMAKVDPYGLRRVQSPRGVLPQAAQVLDPLLSPADDELTISVESLNVDAASFRQIEASVGGDPQKIAQAIQKIVRERGKLHNPVTGSGGMLIGSVKAIGKAHPAAQSLQVGERIASLASLTLTPLVIDEILAVHPKADRVDIRGTAILFSTAAFAPLPKDLPDLLSLAVLDVCGAPAWVHRLVNPGDTVLVIGSGKSGALSCAAAREAMGQGRTELDASPERKGRIIALDLSDEAPTQLVHAGLADHALAANATRPLEVLEKIEALSEGKLCDLVVNCASVPDTEMSAVLSAKEGGKVLFFSMATSFTKSALGAEGLSRDVTLLMGNGYAKGHADYALNLVRRWPGLRRFMESRIGAGGELG